MINKFKVGDRVAVYGNTGLDPSQCGSYCLGSKATVIPHAMGCEFISEVTVEMDKLPWQGPSAEKVRHVVHPYQCRRLVKKKKAKPLRARSNSR